MLLWAAIGAALPCAVHAADQVTILYDAFGKRADVDKDWGFAAFIEMNGKRILFDTGNDARRLETNARALGVDLARLDMVVISHRHWDHTAGMAYVLRVNPRVSVFAPEEEFFGPPTPPLYFSKDADPSLPREMRYFDGRAAGTVAHGNAWPGARLTLIAGATQIAPGIRLIVTTSDKEGTRELHEVSLLLDTPGGAVLIVGCAHPGIEKILANATGDGTHVREIFGGIHEVLADEAAIAATVAEVADHYKVEAVALGHCTGEAAFAAFRRRYGNSYVYAGVGEVIPL